jgi:hypothetical protein
MNGVTITAERQIEYLEKRYRWNHGTARAFVETGGRCMYCDDDVLATVQGYASSQIDHILPKSTFPDFEWNEDNWVLCCSLCNSAKGKVSELRPGEDGVDMLVNHRQALIDRIRERLKEPISKRRSEYEDIKRLLQGSSFIRYSPKHTHYGK